MSVYDLDDEGFLPRKQPANDPLAFPPPTVPAYDVPPPSAAAAAGPSLGANLTGTVPSFEDAIANGSLFDLDSSPAPSPAPTFDLSTAPAPIPEPSAFDLDSAPPPSFDQSPIATTASRAALGLETPAASTTGAAADLDSAPPPAFAVAPATAEELFGAVEPEHAPTFEMPATPPPFAAVPVPAPSIATAPPPAAPSSAAAAPVAAPRVAPTLPAKPPTFQTPPVAATDRIDRSPKPGAGQAGTHPDLIAALNAVVTERASDLHVTVDTPPMIRVDGHLRPVPGMEPWDAEKMKTVLYSILDERAREEFEADLERDMAYQLSDTARMRVNLYVQRGVIGGVFRLIPTEIKPLAELGMPPELERFATLPRGLVLITGPTGSGKSTTLAALIDLVNRTRADHIVTVEDPIEFMHENKKAIVNQREVGHDTHSFANALKHVLRQDPDVILIGELRDLETISVALTAAETGHLVFATLHTQSAPQTIDRILDVFPPHQQELVRTQLAVTLQGVVCQTLIKKASGSGRAVATEVMFTTPAVANLIREGKTYQVTSVLQSAFDQGMHTMDQSLAALVDAGAITRSAAFEKSQDPDTLDRLISRADASGGTAYNSFDDQIAAHAAKLGRH